MGCSSSNMVAVEPAKPTEKVIDINNNKPASPKKERQIGSATSKRSVRSTADSGLGDGESTCITDSFITSRTFSANSRRTLPSLSAKSRTRANEEDILASLKNEGLIATDTHKAKSGVSFALLSDETPRRAPPARLAKLEKRRKKKALLTQQEIQEKLERAEERRKEAENERLSKIQSVTGTSDINNALDAFAKRTQEVKEHGQEKVDTAAEKREQRLKEMRDKLKAKAEYAATVRKRKQSVSQDNTTETTPSS